MEWSPKQLKALNRVGHWIEHGVMDSPLFRLFGYAGTGKTTLAKHLVEQMDGDVFFAAYTGKAASVLKRQGCPNTSTLHRLIYTPIDKDDRHLRELKIQRKELEDKGVSPDDPRLEDLHKRIQAEQRRLDKPEFKLKTMEESPLKDASLLVVDECSMVNQQMAEDLMSFDTPILVLGDPAQLPPVDGKGYFIDAPPDVMLDEVHRQALDNPVLDMATRVRTGDKVEFGAHGNSKVIFGSPSVEELLHADQILVGKNQTRHSLNRIIRSAKGFETEDPQVRDRVVCLKNNHDTGMMNGTLWWVKGVGNKNEKRLSINVENEDVNWEVQTKCHKGHFYGRYDLFDHHNEKKALDQFDYGYALTTHKAQGSEWPSIVVFDESNTFQDKRTQWLYTAITRAGQQVTLIRNHRPRQPVKDVPA